MFEPMANSMDYDPKSDDCVYRKEWFCEIDGDYCDSNIQIGIMCPYCKPPQEEAKQEDG